MTDQDSGRRTPQESDGMGKHFESFLWGLIALMGLFTLGITTRFFGQEYADAFGLSNWVEGVTIMIPIGLGGLVVVYATGRLLKWRLQ